VDLKAVVGDSDNKFIFIGYSSCCTGDIKKSYPQQTSYATVIILSLIIAKTRHSSKKTCE
jgi:hypothetical protein